MSNRLPSTRTTQALSLPEARIEALHGALEAHPAHPTRYCVRSDRAATTAERRALCAVSERLEAELAPCANLKHIDTVVTRVLLGFEQGRGRGDEENDALIGEYLSALKALPLAAIHAAAERFRSATTLLPWNRRFRPSPAEFAAEAREGMVPMRTRLLHVRRVLDAEPYAAPTEAQREKVAAAAEAYLQRAHLPNEMGAQRRETPAEIEAARDAKIRESVARLRQAGRGPEIGRLIAHLDARQSQPRGLS
jgi:hypothetical protein